MRFLKKYAYFLLGTVALIVLFVCASMSEETPLPCFYCYNSDRTSREAISIFDAQDGNYYVFLPSYADIEQLSVDTVSDGEFSLDGTNLVDNMECGEFSLETPYTLAQNGKEMATLWFYKSANVATMYIDTASGSMDRIHADKNYEENAAITLYAADGKIDYQSEVNTLKGRGNATWNYDKRPYSLSLSSEADLLNMGAANDWVLLANATDETNLNNYLALKLASAVSSTWTPECRWVDIYLNGEYGGLYLLAEKVEVANNRLNIDAAAGEFLCKLDSAARWDTLRNPFMTAAGRTVEISFPKYLTEEEIAEIKKEVDQMEEFILSGAVFDAESGIDLDTWVCRYLVDEISANIDSDKISSYFYYCDGVFYAGPVWDYDLTFGNYYSNQEANAFIAKNGVYYSALHQNKNFYNRMLEVYCTEFLPLLQNILDTELDNTVQTIDSASRINSIRWEQVFDAFQSRNPDAVRTPQDLKNYLTRRVEFLNRVWIEGVDYCTVQFVNEQDQPRWSLSIEKGACIETAYIDINTVAWYDLETGERFDFSQPVTEDVILGRQPIDQTNPDQPVETTNTGDEFNVRDYDAQIAIIAVFLVMFVAAVVIDVGHRRKERKRESEPDRTEVPS